MYMIYYCVEKSLRYIINSAINLYESTSIICFSGTHEQAIKLPKCTLYSKIIPNTYTEVLGLIVHMM